MDYYQHKSWEIFCFDDFIPSTWIFWWSFLASISKTPNHWIHKVRHSQDRVDECIICLRVGKMEELIKFKFPQSKCLWDHGGREASVATNKTHGYLKVHLASWYVGEKPSCSLPRKSFTAQHVTDCQQTSFTTTETWSKSNQQIYNGGQSCDSKLDRRVNAGHTYNWYLKWNWVARFMDWLMTMQLQGHVAPDKRLNSYKTLKKMYVIKNTAWQK